MEISLIPLETLPDQEFLITLDGKNCVMRIYLRMDYTYMDLTVDDKELFKGMICLDRTDILQYSHYGFSGKLMFIDTRGSEDPYFTGFNDRWALVYVQ